MAAATQSSNKQLNDWADQRVRTLADLFTRFRYAMDAYKTDYVALGIGAAIITDGASNAFGQQDGRAQVTGLQIQNLKAAIDQVQTAMETTVVSGVGATPQAVVDPIQVNGSPR